MFQRARSISVLIATLAGACGSSDGPGSPSGSGSPSGNASAVLSADVSTYVNALCERVVACGQATPLFTSQAGCVERLVTLYACDARLADASLEGLAACLEALREVPCGRVLARPLEQDPCLATLASLEHALGYSRAEEACSDETRCVAGTSCHRGEDCGICEPWQQAGDTCDSECNGDLFCGEAGRCEPLRIDGDPCAVNQQCFSRSCNAGKCTSPQLGDPCIEGIYCGDGLRCMDGKCALLGKVGDACSQVHDEFPVCTYDAECVDGRCEAISRCGEGQLGSVCSSSAQCAEGFNCSPVEDRCVKRANEGEVCSADHIHCAEGLRCEFKDFEDDGSCQRGAPAAPPAAQLCE